MKLRSMVRSALGGRTGSPPAAADTAGPTASHEAGEPAVGADSPPAGAVAGTSEEPTRGADGSLTAPEPAAGEEPAARPADGGDPAAPAEGDDPPAPAEPRLAPPRPGPRAAALLAQAEDLVAAGDPARAIDLLTAANREERDPFLEHRLVHLRYAAFERLDAGAGRAEWPPVVPDRFEGVEGLPTVDAAELDAEAAASAITHHGALLVRGLVPTDLVARMVADIDQAFEASHAEVYAPVGTDQGSWYQPFRATPDAPPIFGHRWWVREAGGVLAADSPPAFFTMVELFEAAGVRQLVADYLGEPPVFSMDKVTLRRVPLGLHPPEWHQDGQFLGEGIRVLNLWLALSPCGGSYPSPGLDVVPRRFDGLVPTGTDGCYLDWAVGHGQAVRQADGVPLLRPRFEAGDALLFDELFLHRTAVDDTMTEERYAIESWFFAPSSYPWKNAPLVF